MNQYETMMQHILENGVLKRGRNGDYLGCQGYMMKFDMADGFPLITSRPIAFKPIAAELIGFLRGYTNAADFRALGCKWWDAESFKLVGYTPLEPQINYPFSV